MRIDNGQLFSASIENGALVTGSLVGDGGVLNVDGTLAAGVLSSSAGVAGGAFISNGVTFAQFDAGAVNLGGAVLQPVVLSGTAITLGIAGQSMPITAVSSITASSDISSSGTVFGESGSFSHIVGNSPITFGSEVNFSQPISTTNNLTITGSLTVSGSSTFNNIGPFTQTGVSTFNGLTQVTGSLSVFNAGTFASVTASNNVKANGFDTNITEAAKADANFYIINGRKVEVRNQLQSSIGDGAFQRLELRNTSIKNDSIVLGGFIGNTAGDITASIITAAVTKGPYTASITFYNESGVTIADDTPYTASFIVL